MDTWICNEFHEEDTKYDTLFFFTTFSSFFAQSAIHLHHNTHSNLCSNNGATLLSQSPHLVVAAMSVAWLKEVSATSYPR